MPSNLIWNMPACTTPCLYLSFDDGPHEKATPFVLEQLEKFNAKATFFCIGKNVVAHSDIYQKIIDAGHTVGNHTHNHLNGWQTDTKTYTENITTATTYINSNIFRPPYGRIKRAQVKQLKNNYKIYMWDVLSADFDTNISPEKCLKNVMDNIQSGSIVVFHDSEKAWERMSYALPKLLAFCQQNGWQLKALPNK